MQELYSTTSPASISAHKVKRHQLSACITKALAGMLFIAPLSVLAQADATDKAEAEKLEAVTVVGSRIRKQVDQENFQPVLSISKAELKKTGLSNVADVLQNLSVADNSGLSTVTNNTNGNDGTTQVSLRNLGAARTLVLVNGRRWVSDLAGTVDLQTIPLAIVERIEILKDGASAIYGADAIAGVVNVITRDKFDGMEANAYLGQTSEGDGQSESYDFTVGGSNDRAALVAGFAYTRQEKILVGDREISRTPKGCFDGFCSGSIPNGRFTVPGLPGTQTLRAGASGRAASDFRPFTNADRYNFAPVNFLQQPFDRYSGYMQAVFDITDTVQSKTQVNYVKRRSNQQIAEVPLTLATSGANGPQWRFPVSANGVFNPFRQDIPTANFRSIAVGPRYKSFDYDSWIFSSGLNGQFSLGERSFYWDATYQYLDSQNDSRGENYINLFNLRNAVGPSFRDANGVLRCGTATAVIAGCTPFNLFGGPDLGLGAGVINQGEYEAMIDYVGYDFAQTQGVSTRNYAANITGDLFELQGGAAAFAAGWEYRDTNGFFAPDALIAEGGSSDNFTLPTQGKIRSSDFFLELNAPLLADVAFAKSLEFNLAGRYSSYDSSGLATTLRPSDFAVTTTRVTPDLGSDTTGRFGLKWQPVEDVLLRANYAQTYRAPSISDLFAGLGEGFPQATDPCSTRGGAFARLTTVQQARCIAQGVPAGGAPQPNGQLRSLSGGNPNLKPETGTNTTFGVVYSPDYLAGFNVSLDYYKIKLNDAITGFGAQTILNRCIQDGQAELCPRILRVAGTGEASVLTTGFNAAELETSGLDFGSSYRFETDRYGAFSSSLNSTYTIETSQRTRLGDGTLSDMDNEVGEYSNDVANFRIRANLSNTWTQGPWNATWTVRYLSRQEDNCDDFVGLSDSPECAEQADGSGINSVGGVTYHDFQGSYSADWKGTFTLGIRNAFEKAPPVMFGSFANNFGSGYDVPGSFWYASYSQTF
jgi:iron complex outermembrane recepter protein